MSLFEYIAVASSIILSFAVVRLLDTITHAFSPSRRYGVHCAFVVAALWGSVQFWWVSWSMSGNVRWNYPKFLLYLAAPAIIYSLARTLSSPDPSRVDSFREHFDRIHGRFFGLLSAYLLLLMLLGWLLQEVPLLHPLRAFQLVGVLAAASGIVVANSRYHAFLAGFFLIVLAIGTFGIFTEPGGGFVSEP